MRTTTGRGARIAALAGALVGVVVLAALVLAVWLAGRDDPVGGQPSLIPSTTATASASTEPTDTPATSPTAPGETPVASPPAVGWTWELHELPGGPVRGAARIGDRWVALDGLQAWTSTDGAAWEAAQVDDTPPDADGQLNLGPVAVLGDSAYAVGVWYGPLDVVHPVVWHSDDGTAWTQVPPSTRWGYLANDVASDGARLAVAGTYFGYGDGRVWTSSDAATWTEHVSDGGPATLHAIHGDADGFVAVGFRLDAQEARLPAIWYSPDGDGWTDAAVPAADGPFTLLDVARMPGGRYVALGIRGTETETGVMVTWFADDPLTWDAGAELTGGLVPGHLLVTGDGMLAITGALDGPEVRFSTDGVNWSDDPSFPLPDVVTRVSAVAGDGATVMLLGGTNEGDAHFVWTGRPASD